MELTLYVAHVGDHVDILGEKSGLILKDIVIIEETSFYMNMYNTTTQGSNLMVIYFKILNFLFL